MSNFIPPTRRTFVVWDYVIFVALLVCSASIGVFFAVKERKKRTAGDFLVAGKQLTCGPVALSLTASLMSAVTILGTPADVYRFGACYAVFFLPYTFAIIITSELFVPVFYRSGITSTYEYVELRFNKVVRCAATGIYLVQTSLYTGVVIYAPALALNQVTGLDLWGAVFATGIVCTFYCTLGGLKAVVWTDAFQMVVMIVGFLSVLIQGTIINNGTTNIWNINNNGSRLNVFDFDTDPLRRHTFWTIAVGGTFTWSAIYGVNQTTIQKCISCKSELHAKLALYLNLLGLWIILICAVFSGLLMYAHFRSCDPWTAGFISAPDQLLPYYVMDVFTKMPGLPGLFVACAFSGTLSTVAGSINGLATVTYEDFVKSCCKNISDRKGAWISKGLCVLFGVLCTSMAVVASFMGGIIQAAGSIHGMCGGPMLGLFTLGIVFPWTNWKGALGGLFTGITLAFWVAIGAFIYPAPLTKSRPLELDTSGCKVFNESMYSTVIAPTAAQPFRPELADTWYSLSYLYISAVGCLSCIIAGLLISFITGYQRPEDVEPLLIRPVCNILWFWSPKMKTLCWCGVQHDREDIHEKNDDIAFQMDITDKPGKEHVSRNGLNNQIDQGNQISLSGEKNAYINKGFDIESYF
ncbi:sodium-coupled monocarboxylate transporter 2-like [Lissotriton helveticus]